jgi:hypothetical protein
MTLSPQCLGVLGQEVNKVHWELWRVYLVAVTVWIRGAEI